MSTKESFWALFRYYVVEFLKSSLVKWIVIGFAVFTLMLSALALLYNASLLVWLLIGVLALAMVLTIMAVAVLGSWVLAHALSRKYATKLSYPKAAREEYMQLCQQGALTDDLASLMAIRDQQADAQRWNEELAVFRTKLKAACEPIHIAASDERRRIANKCRESVLATQEHLCAEYNMPPILT